MEHPFVKIRDNQNIVRPEIVAPDFVNRWEEGLSHEAYHEDRTAMSSSMLRTIVKQSPKHLIQSLAGVLDEEEEQQDEKKHYKFGRIAHAALLEPARFLSSYAIMPEFTGLTKEGKISSQSGEARDKKKAWLKKQPPETMIVTSEEYEMLMGSVESILSHETARNLLKNGRAEVTGYFRDPITGLKCKIRPDFLTPDPDNPNLLHVVDFKTSRDSSMGLFSKAMNDYMYHVQLAFYCYGVKQITGQDPVSATFIVCEKKAPYDASVYILEEADVQVGLQWVTFGLQVYKRCLELNRYPGRQTEAQIIRLPKYSKDIEFPHFDFGENQL
jgi:hypothetical protein